jgi:hypothetical protein
LITALPEEGRAVLRASGPVMVEEGDRTRVYAEGMLTAWEAVLDSFCGKPRRRVLGAIEAVGGSPQMGVASAFAFGRAAGVLEGVLAGLGLAEVARPAPAVWKARMGLAGGRKGKGESIALAARLTRTGAEGLDEHVAEAVLVGWFAALQHAGAAQALARRRGG